MDSQFVSVISNMMPGESILKIVSHINEKREDQTATESLQTAHRYSNIPSFVAFCIAVLPWWLLEYSAKVCSFISMQ